YKFSFSCSAHNSDLHSFPTRRSSDLPTGQRTGRRGGECRGDATPGGEQLRCRALNPGARARRRSRHLPSRVLPDPASWWPAAPRSEEHTSELQSPYDLVCRLLLEKKK